MAAITLLAGAAGRFLFGFLATLTILGMALGIGR
jgi:hypothetical protein